MKVSSANTVYEVGRPSCVCAVTGRDLLPGESIVSALVERTVTTSDNGDTDSRGSESEIVRIDVAADAWDGSASLGDALAVWHSRVPEPNAAKSGPRIDAGSMLELFEQLSPRADASGEAAAEARRDVEDASAEALCYVLALMLLRKRALVPAGSEARGVMLVSPKMPASSTVEQAVYRVTQPSLDDAALMKLTEQITEALDLEGP